MTDQTIINKINSIVEQDSRPLTFQEASKYLDISASYLYKLTSTAKICHFKPSGKKIYFKKSDLQAFLLRNRVASQSELEQKAIDYVNLGKGV
ncbi:MAG: helix-turn-helix domain-containing protein [Bacteroidetes bacterium]|nr:helix-turn-helix domain-containing protein [Bacteroidota bacterium]MBU1114373.1 helix-turn-helix domain-containing protein [Bacteroidota bacterium]MBU1798332.1 helix-turn-helix domain-containing protein [Bacteroidota bacterium]